jgi:hypothetical protein
MADNLGLLKQLQTDDPSSPGNSIMHLLRAWAQWRMRQEADPENPPMMSGAMNGINRQALARLQQLLEARTDKAMRASGAVTPQPRVSDSLLAHGLITPEAYAQRVAKDAAKTWEQGYPIRRPDLTVEGQFAPPVYATNPETTGFKDSIQPQWDLPGRATRDPVKFQSVQDSRLIQNLREMLGLGSGPE